MQIFLDVLSGMTALLDVYVLAFMIVGFLIGTFFGAMPGLTSVLAIALLLPITYTIDVVPALVMCASIFMAGMYSGSITATTINIPGAPSSMMTAIEGNRLMNKGFGANALGHAALGSMIGGAVGAVLLMAFMPIAAEISLLIRTPGKFSLVLFALVVIVIVDKDNIAKGFVATLLGVMIATVGIDVLQPIPRFNFGTETLVEGIDIMPLVIGAFAISEVLMQSENWKDSLSSTLEKAKNLKIRRRDFIPPRSEIREIGLFAYRRRWSIECLFGDAKTRGLNLEDTRLTSPRKISLLLAIVAIAIAWSSKIAVAVAVTGSAARPRKPHGYPAKSWFRTGFDALRNRLRNDIERAIQPWTAMPRSSRKRHGVV